jgi:hypothetical protein
VSTGQKANRTAKATRTTKAKRAGRKAKHSPVLDHAVRLGLVCFGVVHLLIAWLAGQLALGHHAGQASGSGALSELAQKPFGQILLWVVAVGFFALVLWQAAEALLRHDEDGAKLAVKKVGSAGKAVIYAVLGVSALKIALGGGSSSGGSGGSTDTLTARLMSMPGGQLIVGAIGIGILVVAAAHVYKGFTEDFRDKMNIRGNTGTSGRVYVALGMVGYVAKGVALSVVAGLFCWAAATHDPQKSGGLDQALKTVLDQPFGSPLLLVIAVGLACYGLFCFAWARHLDH